MKKFIIFFILGILLFALIIGRCNQGDTYIGEETADHVVARDLEKAPAIRVQSDDKPEDDEPQVSINLDSDGLEIPVFTKERPSQLLRRKAYMTSYNRETRCPNWVAWRLTEEHTDGPYNRKGVPYYDDDGIAIGIGRVTEETQKGDYFADMECEEPRQSLFDWSTEYNMSHGHLCPAGDNRWDKEAMNQSFLLTNMCPQDYDLNGGGWKKLEEKCRKWAERFGEVYIVAGPIFRGARHKKLGEILIPEAFFKVVLCMKGEPKAVGFIYENDSQSQSMYDNVCSVDEVEAVTGMDFFSALPDSIENEIEAKANLNDWK